MVEEAAGAAQSLQERATGLAELVSVFRLGGRQAGSSARVMAPATTAVRLTGKWETA
jgi:hypothetical protein